MLRCCFMGTSSFALPFLRAVFHHHHSKLVAVFSRPDAPAGRGLRLQASPVKQFSLSLDLDCFENDILRNEDFEKLFRSLNVDLGIVVAYGRLIPQKILDIPRYGFINVHPSLLPKYRGASPIQTALAEGEVESGITIIKMTKDMDAGPICAQKKESVLLSDDTESLEKRLALSGVPLICECLDALENFQKLEAFEQNETEKTYCHKIDAEFSFIDWSWSSFKILNRLRSLSRPKGGKTFWGDKLLKILEIVPEHIQENPLSETPGKVLLYDKKLGLKIATGTASVFVKKLQLQGGRPLSIQDFMNGRGIGILGSVLSKKLAPSSSNI